MDLWESRTDYTLGEEPVEVGTVVQYRGTLWTITGQVYPESHPHFSQMSEEDIVLNYPDGVAYDLWPVGIPYKFGHRMHAVYFVRRTSFKRH